MKKQTTKTTKLTLDNQTIRPLVVDPSRLVAVAGGLPAASRIHLAC